MMNFPVGLLATVHAETRVSYGVCLQRGLLGWLVNKLEEFDRVHLVVLLTDANVDALYAADLAGRMERAGLGVLKYAIEPRRTRKSLDTAADLFRVMFQRGANRDVLVLNLGGGTVGDLGGFVAALYLRGVRYIHIPTTLISQADSGIGGKVNVNFGEHVNSLSVFHHPAAVWIDPDLLRTLPREEYLSGLAEIVKYAVVLDPELFVLLEENAGRLADPTDGLIEEIIRRCVERKCEIVSEDPQEKGRFRFYNYGHEIGHAVEVAYDYHDLLHGEAVAIGMSAAAGMGVEAGLTDESLFRRQGALLSRLGLPRAIPEGLRRRFIPSKLARRIGTLLGKDKKRTAGGQVWIIPQRLGEALCTDQIGGEFVERCLQRVAEGAVE